MIIGVKVACELMTGGFVGEIYDCGWHVSKLHASTSMHCFKSAPIANNTGAGSMQCGIFCV